jgi:hypothetical protein
MMSCRQQILMEHFGKIRVDWRKSHSVLAMELQTLMAETVEINTKDNLEGKPCQLSEFNLIRLKENLEQEKT